jgi:hypothetical protein
LHLTSEFDDSGGVIAIFWTLNFFKLGEIGAEVEGEAADFGTTISIPSYPDKLFFI